jgi:hypothetical protein
LPDQIKNRNAICLEGEVPVDKHAPFVFEIAGHGISMPQKDTTAQGSMKTAERVIMARYHEPRNSRQATTSSY